jgi:hypothetical protein
VARVQQSAPKKARQNKEAKIFPKTEKYARLIFRFGDSWRDNRDVSKKAQLRVVFLSKILKSNDKMQISIWIYLDLSSLTWI